MRLSDTTSDTAAATPAPRERAATARRLLLDAVVLGGLADAFLHNGFGVGLFIFMLVCAGTFTYIERGRGGLSREQAGWMLTALFFASIFAIRDSSELGFYNFVAMLTALALLGATSSPASPVRTILGQR